MDRDGDDYVSCTIEGEWLGDIEPVVVLIVMILNQIIMSNRCFIPIRMVMDMASKMV